MFLPERWLREIPPAFFADPPDLTMVPFLDLNSHHASRREEFLQAIAGVIDSGIFAGGPIVTRFEQAFARSCETKQGVGLGNGTDALFLSLLALGIGAGDEVITVSNTFIATAEAITLSGAKPVFVDVSEETATLDPQQLEKALTPRTRAIIPVHLWGQCAEMDDILEFARAHRLKVIEDACQAHGARYKGRPAGSLGDTGCFSFYPGKNLGAFGEAGAVLSQDADLAQRIRVLRDHGQIRKYVHSVVGYNGRMDAIQAAVLEIKLRTLPEVTAARRLRAQWYRERLEDEMKLILPTEASSGEHGYHIFAVRVAERDRVLGAMAAAGVHCGVHYPIPIHLQDAYRNLEYRPGDLPVTERLCAECLSLPLYPELTEAQVDEVCSVLTKTLETVTPHPVAVG